MGSYLMKFQNFLLSGIAAAAAVAVTASAADSAATEELEMEPNDVARWYLSPGLGWANFEGDEPLKDGFYLTLRLGYDINQWWSVEGGCAYAPTLDENTHGRLIDGRYPNYNSVIPQNNPYKATIDRAALVSTLKRVLVFSSQSSAQVKLAFGKDKLTVSGQDIDFSTSAEERLMCEYDSPNLAIGFKGTLLLDILGNLESSEVVFELADPGRAGIIKPAEQKEGEEILMLLMPMMLND